MQQRFQIFRSVRRGFTVVELLVVIGILSVLIAILLPAVGRARQVGYSALCASNLRQLQQACTNYVQDNSGYLPPAHIDFITKNLHRWHGTRTTMSDPFEFGGSSLKKYLQMGAIKQCPSFDAPPKGFEKSAGGYGYNDHFLGSSMEESAAGVVGLPMYQKLFVNRPAKMASIVRPSETILFADAAMANPGLIEYSFVEPPLAGGIKTSPSIHFRHNSRANVVWLDGHVTSELMEWTYPGKNAYGVNNAQAKLGFFGPRDNSLFDRR